MELFYSISSLVILFILSFSLYYLVRAFLIQQEGSKNSLIQLSEALMIYRGVYDNPRTNLEGDLCKKVLYWDDYCLDTSHYGLSILDKVNNISPQVSIRKERFMNENRNNLTKFLLSHYDDRSGGFRHNKKAWPTIYATYCAIGYMKRFFNLETSKSPLTHKNAKDIIGEHQIPRIFHFISSCEFKTGGYGGFPFGTPSLLNTFSAVLILWNLGGSISKNQYDKLTHFILSCFKGNEGIGYGFSNSPNENKPCICLTRYAIATLLILEALRKNEAYWGNLEENDNVVNRKMRNKIDKFITSCRKPDGSFSRYPDEISSLTTTNIVFSYIELAPKTFKEKILFQNDDTQILDFINIFRSSGGFAFNEGLKPNLLATKSAVTILETLKNNFNDSNHINERDLDNILNFTTACFNPTVGGFTGYESFPN